MKVTVRLNLKPLVATTPHFSKRIAFQKLKSIVLVFFLAALFAGKAKAQFSTPAVDAAFDGNATYPNSYNSGATTWHMTWDDSSLFVFLQNANQGEPVTIYLDIDPIVPVNGGNDASGTLVGLNYDGYTTRPNLPFRADVAIYCHNGYRELFRRNGSNGWTSLGGGSSGIRGDGTSDYAGGNPNGQYASHDNGNGNGGDDRREFRISWNRLLGTINGGNRPASFNWMGYVSYNNGMYAQVPVENYNGSDVSGNSNGITRYFTVSSTTNGAVTNPFGRNSYTHPITATNNSFGAIAVWDFTMNSPGQQIARLNSGGNWTIGRNLVVGDGTVFFGSGGSGYGTTAVAGDISLLGGTLNMDQTNKSLDVSGNIAIASGASLILSGTMGGDIKTAGNWTRDVASTFNPNGRAVFFNGNNTQYLSMTGGGTETFNYLQIAGSGTLRLTAGTNATVNTANGLTLASSHATSTLDLNGQALTVSGGGILNLASGNRKITSSLSGGIFNVNTNGLGIANPGTLEFDTNTTLVLETGFDFGAGNSTTINGTLQLNLGAFVNVNAPKYGPSSLLRYNSGSNYERRIEWNSNIGGTFGVPHHVTITNNTTLNYPFGTPGPLGMTGNLTLDVGSRLFMDYGTVNSNGPLTVMGNIVSSGDMSLGTLSGNDLKVGGDITFASGYSFDSKNRAVFFIKNGIQRIAAPASSPPTFHYMVFQPSGGNTTVELHTDLAITAPDAGNVISFSSANDVLDLNGKALTLGTAGTSNTLFGPGSFKGSTASGLTLLGNGSIGTVRFATVQALGNLTVDREDGILAMTLGTPLTVNTSLTLAKGLIDLDTYDLSLNLATTATGSPASYVIVDESGTSGRLRKRVSSTNNSFTFPIGDKFDAGENGSQYTPATVTFTGGTFSTAYMMVAVRDQKHPDMQATADYLTRYWRITSTGITGAAAYSFSGKYHATPSNYDVAGVEGNSFPGRWNGIQWTEGATAIGTTANTLDLVVYEGGTSADVNYISAGYPLGAPEISVVGNNLNIPSGAGTPIPDDFTDFGSSQATRSSTFLIQNSIGSKGLLEIADVIISGTHASDFSITTAPVSPVLVGGTTYLVIRFTPSGPGIRTAKVTIENNDPDESSYTFDIQGRGIDYIECSFGPLETIARQDFENVPAEPVWGYGTPPPAGAAISGGNAYGASGDGGNSNAFIGARSLQVNNANATIIFDAIDTSNLTDVSFSMRIAAFSSVSTTSGLDNPDYIRVSISKDDGATWMEEITLNGNNNAKWSFTSGTASGTTVYDGNGIVENQLRPAGGGYRTTDGYSKLEITNLPPVETLRIRIILLNNDPNEIWAIDDIELKARRKSRKIWNGSVWSGDGNPPTASEMAIINGDYGSQANGSFDGCECEVTTGKTLTISPGHYIDIQGDLRNDGTIVLEDSASLVQHNDLATNTGTIILKRNTQPVFRYDFTYWSSPLTLDSGFKLGNHPTNSLSPGTLFDKFFKWGHDAATPVWQVIQQGDEVMHPGTGYIVRAPQNFDVQGQVGATAQIYGASFIGKPNNGTIEHPVTGSGTETKWNLLGNPYPSAINIETFLYRNNTLLDGTIYLWRHNTQIQETGTTGIYAYSPSDYATFNFSGSTATTAAASSGGAVPDEFLASAQAFFVKGIASGNTVFDNSMRVAGNNSQFFKPALSEPVNNWQLTGKHRIWLNLTGQGAFNQTLVGYIENATNVLDWGYDGDHFGGNKVSFYSISQNRNLAIQGRALPFSNQDQVPLGYKTALTGTLKISIDHYDGLFEGQDIYLEDLLLDVVHDLKAADYSFAAVPGTFNNRFVLRYVPQQTLGNPALEETMAGVVISKDKNELNVRATLENISTITIYDILGRTVFYQDKINSNHFRAADIGCDRQTLIVKVQLANNATVTKKVLF